MERDDHDGRSLLESEGADVVVHRSAGRDGCVGVHYDPAVALLLEEAKGVDDVVAEVEGAEGEFCCGGFVGNEERGGAAGELDEVQEVEANGAFERRVGEVEEVDDGRSVVLAVDAGHHAQFGVGECVLYASSSLGLFVSF